VKQNILAESKKQFLYFGLFSALLVFGGFLLYSPGLAGSFLLDDILHLSRLSDLKSGNIDLQEFVLAGGGGPSGRPVAYFTYAIQASSWPGAYAFKLANLLIHLANGLLVFFIVFAIAKRTIPAPSGRQNALYPCALAFAVAVVWLCNPIQTSAVHYVIQRMALLSAFWCFLGIFFYIKATDFPDHRPLRYVMFFLYGCCLLLGVYSKENAIVLPLLIGAFSVTVLREILSRIPLWERALTLYLPVLAFVGYIGFRWEKFLVTSYLTRDFSLGERLLTQLNVLSDYLSGIVMPMTDSYYLFYENYEISKSFGQSAFGFMVVFGLLAGAFLLRKRQPWIAGGILFYFAGHIVESSFLSLELYFEHRNYLPMLGIAMALVGGVLAVIQQWPGLKIPVFILSFLWLVHTGIMSYQHSALWGNPKAQAVHWYEQNPSSHRAHGHLAKTMFRSGALDSLASFYDATIDLFPDDLSKPLLWIELNCQNAQVQLPSVDRVRATAANAAFNKETLNLLNGLLRSVEQGKCTSQGYGLIVEALTGLLKNERFEGVRPRLNILAGKTMALVQNYREAIYFMEQADKSSGFRVDVKLALAQLYMRTSSTDKAKEVLASVKRHCDKTKAPSCFRNNKARIDVLDETGLTDWYNAL